MTERPLAVGLLHYSCPPVVGGVEEIVRQQAQVLTRLGQSVRVLAGEGREFHEGVEVTVEPLVGSRAPEIERAHRALEGGRGGEVEGLVARIAERVVEWARGLDVVLAHNVLQMPFNLPLVLALHRVAEGGGVRLVSWAHDSPYFGGGEEAARLEAEPWRILRTPHPRISYVTISESRRRLFRGIMPGVEWHVVPNGIDPQDFFYLAPATARLAEELRLFERDLVIVQPARVTPRKNQELALRIVHSLHALGHDVLFLLTGAFDPHREGAAAYFRRLEALQGELALQDHVAVLARYRFRDGEPMRLDRVVMRDLYLVADLLLMTSVDEGFGLPLLEAGMIKLPIVCTNLPIFREIGREVCFIRPEDPPAFSAGRIVEFLARTAPHAMYRHVMRNYLWSRICRDRLLPLLREVVGDG